MVNTYIASWRNVLQGIRTHRDLPPRQLDPALGEFFTLESNPTSVFLQRIHSVIPNLASHACPPTIPRESCSQYFLDILSPTSYKSRLKKVANVFHQYTLYNTFYNDNQDNVHLLPSILSSTISDPLVGMNRSIINHRLNGTECQIMLRQKHRLNVFPHDFPCTCGKTHDAKGDQAFCCSRSHKGSVHNQIAHQIARAIGPALAAANITRTDNSMETEPRLYLTPDPLSHPYDISFNPNNPNHQLHKYNTINWLRYHHCQRYKITPFHSKPLQLRRLYYNFNCQCRHLSSGLREEKTQQNQQHEIRPTCTRQESHDWRLTP